MKKATPYLFAVSAAGITIMLAGTISYMLMPPGSMETPQLQVSPQLAREMSIEVLQDKCGDCHGDNPSYSGFVNFVTGGLLQDDVERAQRAFTITPNPAVRSPEVDYLKMDRVLTTRRMPPARYSAVHLGTRLTPDDVTVLRTYYTPEGAAVRRFRPIVSLPESERHSNGAAIYNAMADGARLLGVNPNKVLLGHMLFFETGLSSNDQVACYSCHALTTGGVDNKPKSEGVPGPDGNPQLGGVNAPTVYNTSGNIAQFWDGRAATLAEQAGGPPLNPVEMGYSEMEDWATIAEKLSKNPEIAALFQEVYGDKGICQETITDAIATFEMCLITPGSDFDAYLMGDTAALTPEQVSGMDAFVAYGCVSCHGGPTLGGRSYENINTFSPLRDHMAGYTDCTSGHADFTGDAAHTDMFRVPNLRNVALTAPYFHTGTVEKLEDAVRIMFITQVGIEPSATTVDNVTAFLHAQTGKLGGVSLAELDVAQVVPAYMLREDDDVHDVMIEPAPDDEAPATAAEPATEPTPAEPVTEPSEPVTVHETEPSEAVAVPEPEHAETVPVTAPGPPAKPLPGEKAEVPGAVIIDPSIPECPDVPAIPPTPQADKPGQGNTVTPVPVVVEPQPANTLTPAPVVVDSCPQPASVPATRIIPATPSAPEVTAPEPPTPAVQEKEPEVLPLPREHQSGEGVIIRSITVGPDGNAVEMETTPLPACVPATRFFPVTPEPEAQAVKEEEAEAVQAPETPRPEGGFSFLRRIFGH